MNKIKTAVVGVGSLGRHHARWLTQLDKSDLVGVYDIDQEKAQERASDLGVAALTSLDDVADQADAVSIVVTTSAHYDVASQLIEAGVHCLIEKPVVPSIDAATKLQQLADSRNVKVTVGQIERFNPAVRGLAEHDVHPAFIEAHRMAAFDPRGTDVAVVLDLMIHDIDLALMFTKSKVSDIQSSAVSVISDQVDIANARLTFENGTVANLTASRISLTAMRKLRFFQQSGYFSLDLAKKQADIYRLGESGGSGDGMRIPLGKSDKDVVYTMVSDDGRDMLGMELDAFLDSVMNDKPVAVTLADATEAVRVALEVERIGKESVSRMMAAQS